MEKTTIIIMIKRVWKRISGWRPSGEAPCAMRWWDLISISWTLHQSKSSTRLHLDLKFFAARKIVLLKSTATALCLECWKQARTAICLKRRLNFNLASGLEEKIKLNVHILLKPNRINFSLPPKRVCNLPSGA